MPPVGTGQSSSNLEFWATTKEGMGGEMAQSLSRREVAEARALYEEFWRMYPDQKNPSDINTREKATFLILKGFERISLMQRARKQKYDFTRHVPA